MLSCMQDGELYELVGAGWRFPVWVRWVKPTLAEVLVAEIPTLLKQKEAVETALRAGSSHREGKGWYFSKRNLQATALRSLFTEPEDVVIWGRLENNALVKTDFVAAYCESRDAVVRNANSLAVIWDSLCKFMLEWMVFQNQTVDFGFARMDALCARANWKNVLMGRLMAMQANGEARTPEGARRAVRKMMHQSSFTAYDPETRTMRWTLEVTPQKPFNDAVEIGEVKRKRQAYGKYLYQILKLLKGHGQKERLYEILTAYFTETTRPYAALPHGFEPGGAGEIGNGGNAGDGGGPEIPFKPAAKWHATPVVTGHAMGDKTGRAVVPEDALLPTVQDLQCLSQDLRHAGGVVDGAGPNGTGPVGLLMFSAGKKRRRRQLLVKRPDGGDAGVAESSEQPADPVQI